MMNPDTLSIEQVRSFTTGRETDLAFAQPPPGFDLFLKASFDGEGAYFGIGFREVDYVCIPGGVEVADLHMGQFEELTKQFVEFKSLAGYYSGPALVIETGEVGSGVTNTVKRYIIVAEYIEITRGPDWPRI